MFPLFCKTSSNKKLPRKLPEPFHDHRTLLDAELIIAGGESLCEKIPARHKGEGLLWELGLFYLQRAQNGSQDPISVFPGEEAQVQRPGQAALGTLLLALDLGAIS